MIRGRRLSGRSLAWAGVALLLAVSAAYFAVQLAQALAQRSRQQTAAARLAAIRKTVPAPTEENLERIQAEVAELRERLARTLPAMPTGVVARPSEQALKLALARTLADLHANATSDQVQVRPGCAFGFDTESRRLGYPADSIPQLWAQLRDIEAICAALFRARILRLEGIRRVAPTDFGPPHPGDILGGTGLVKSCVVPGALLTPPRAAPLIVETWPYEFTFDCRRERLGTVLDELRRNFPTWAVTELSLSSIANARPKPVGPPPMGPKPQLPRVKGPPPPKHEEQGEDDRLRVKLRVEVLRPVP
jgi:hypothetical protein